MPSSELSKCYLDNKKDMVPFNRPFIFNYHEQLYVLPTLISVVYIGTQNFSNNWNFPDIFIQILCTSNSLFLHKAVTAFLAAMKLADAKLNCPFVHRSFRGSYQKMMKCSISNLCLVSNLQLRIFQSEVLEKHTNLPNMIKNLNFSLLLTILTKLLHLMKNLGGQELRHQN